jgi:protein tyrosine phosphatase
VFQDIPCLEATRVHLKAENFIHANYINSVSNSKRFIATQAPLDNTVQDFWRMIIEEESEVSWIWSQSFIFQVIVMLENDMKKCAVYFPKKVLGGLFFGDLKVSNDRVSFFWCWF